MIWAVGGLIVILLALGFHVATALGALAFSLGELFAFFPITDTFGQIAWSVSTNFILVAAPLFILMGELLLVSGVAERMYRALDKWINWLPGGLMHTNVAATAFFAASSGSSAATAATIGTLAMPNMERAKYSPPLFLGTLAAGGTLGILIPPSVNLIIYGVLTETSVPRLYLAGLIPGVLLAFLFSLTVLIVCLLRPGLDGVREPTPPLSERLRSLVHLLPPLGLFIVVVGSIYLGIATPTEAAAVGVMAALALAAFNRTLSVPVMLEAFARTIRTICMIKLIVLAAFLLNFVMINVGFTDALVDFVVALEWTPTHTMLAIIAVYLVLGCFMETMSMMIATTPIVVPVVVSLGYDPVWFGVVLMLLIETAMITPPVGLNLFIIHGVRGKGDIRDVVVGAAPFMLTMLVMIFLCLAFPQIALWLPDLWSASRG